MKALICISCSTIRSPLRDGTWTFCECQKSAIKWENARTGKVVLWTVAMDYPRHTKILGLHNGVLTSSAKTEEEWRLVHQGATENSEGYIFHTTHRNCWACVFHPRETSDSRWANNNEIEELLVILTELNEDKNKINIEG